MRCALVPIAHRSPERDADGRILSSSHATAPHAIRAMSDGSRGVAVPRLAVELGVPGKMAAASSSACAVRPAYVARRKTEAQDASVVSIAVHIVASSPGVEAGKVRPRVNHARSVVRGPTIGQNRFTRSLSSRKRGAAYAGVRLYFSVRFRGNVCFVRLWGWSVRG
jgi:hypothetical protein